MTAIIIPFLPPYRKEAFTPKNIEPLIHAAWQFARCALWPEQHFSKAEVEASQDYIREYFTAAATKKRAFTALCQRVILTQKYIRKSSERFLPLPSVWFNRRYPFGFAGTLAWLYGIERQRKVVPGYLAHFEALAEGYYDYAMKPTKKRFNKCREKLLHYHADSLLQLLDATIINPDNIRA